MNPIPPIKRFILRALSVARGLPLREELLQEACSLLAPPPLKSDLRQALAELEADAFIQAARDDLDPALLTYTLTEKGKHKAQQL
ncbi:MAG: hypothetical protein C5B50_07845 [Verrucomicrobia bacterium]|nr:MAG: hypothetical protein C5B50_07845 [Verrucomicrobiota bacterium]